MSFKEALTVHESELPEDFIQGIEAGRYAIIPYGAWMRFVGALQAVGICTHIKNVDPKKEGEKK